MNGRRLWERVRRVWITLGLTFTVVFTGWSLIAYRATAEAKDAVLSDGTVTVLHERGVWHFTPTVSSRADAPALVFFPGALVDPLAYAPLLRAAAQSGFPAYLVEVPRRGAFGGADDPELGARVQRLLVAADAPGRWLLAGHSKGAVIASDFATRSRPGFAGLVLIGSSHPRDVDLSGLSVGVTKIVGTHDGLASPPEVEANRGKLPAHTRWVWVEGGNHSQFGWYGFQPGDRFATIDASAQRAQMISAVLDALRGVDTTSSRQGAASRR